MRRGVILLAPVAAVVAIGVACGDPYAAGDAPPNAADGGEGQGDSSTSDVGTGDAPPSGIDAGEDGGADGGCPRVLEEHFTTSAMPPPGWVASTVGGGTSAWEAVGAGGAMKSTVTANASDGRARIERSFSSSTAPSRVRLGYTMKLTSTTGYYEPGCVLFIAGAGAGELTLHAESEDSQLWVDDFAKNDGTTVTTAQRTPVGSVDNAHSYSVVFELRDITTTSAKATFSIDGTTVNDRTVMFPTPPESVSVRCGVDYSDIGVAAVVYIDDVLVDICQ